MTDFQRTAFILGGARSGKTRFAQSLVESRQGRWVYLATAEQRGDAEMATRIEAHRAERGERWTTVEEPVGLPAALLRCRRDDIVLVDCLTLWLSNLLEQDRNVGASSAALVSALAGTPASVVLVSNEVGEGIVPANALARRFRDVAGRLHQSVAAAVDDVFLIKAGLPLRLKPSNESH